MRSRTRRVAALALSAAFILAGCGAQAQDLSVGDCLDKSAEGAAHAKVVDCDEAHEAQVIGVYEPTRGPYPSAEVLTAEAESTCAAAFEQFVGSDPMVSVLDLFPLLPTRQAWEAGDVTVACVASTYNGQTVRSSFENTHR